MACNWIYRGKTYTEGQFIALMAKGELDQVTREKSFGQTLEDLGKQMEKGVDDFFAQNQSFSFLVPPSVVKTALKGAAKIIQGGGKVAKAVEYAIRHINKNIAKKLNEVQTAAIRQMVTKQLKDSQVAFNQAISQTPQGTHAYREMLDVLFNEIETQLETAKDKTEVASAIEDFFKNNKDLLPGLSSRRIIRLFVNAGKAHLRGDVRQFLSRAKAILNDNEIERKADRAEDLQSAIGKNIGQYTNVKEQVAEFLQVDPELLGEKDKQLLDQYIAALEDLNRRGIKGTAKMQAILPQVAMHKAQAKARKITGMASVINAITTLDEIRDYIRDEVMANISSLEDVRSAARKLSMIATRAQELLDEAEMNGNTQLVQEISDFIDNELPSMLNDNAGSQQLKALVDQLKADTIATAASIQVNPAATGANRESAVRKFLGWKKEDLMRMSPAEILNYLKIKQELQAGYVPPQMHEMNIKIEAKKNAETIKAEVKEAGEAMEKLPTASKWLSGFFGDVKGVNAKDIAEKIETRGKQFWDDMFGTAQKRTFWRTLVHPVSKSFVEASKSMNQDMAEFNAAVSKIKGFATRHLFDVDTKSFNRTMSKLGIILAQLDHQSNTEGWGDPDYPYNKDLFMRVSTDPKQIQNVPKDKLKIDTEAYEELVKMGAVVNGVLDPQKAMSLLSPEEKQLLKAFQAMLDKQKPKVEVMMEKRGEAFVPQVNYFPRSVISDFSETEAVNSILAMAGVNQSGNAVSARASATKKRIKNAVNYYNFNLEQVANKHARQVNQDFYLTDSFKTTMSTLSTIAKEYGDAGMTEQQTMALAIKKALFDAYKQELSTQYHMHSISRQVVDHLISAARNLTLSNPTRILTEGVSNMIRTMDVPSDSFNADAPLWDAITDELSSAVYLKNSKWSLENRLLSRTTMAKANDVLMAYADSLMSKQLWVDNFKKYFKSEAGVEFNPEKWNDKAFREKYAEAIEKSAALAENDVNRYYNAQTGFSAPTKMKIMPFVGSVNRDSLTAKLLGYMNSFAANEAMLVRMGLKNLSEGNVAKGTSQLTRVMASNFVFTLSSTYMGAALKGMFDDDDDYPWEEGLEPFMGGNLSQTMKNATLATLSSALLGRFSNIFRLGSGLALGFANETNPNSGSVKLATKYAKEVFYIKPVIVSSDKRDPRNQFDFVIENMAPGLGMTVADLAEGISSGVKLATDGGKPSDKLVMARAGMYALSAISGGIPVANMANRFLKSEISSKQKSEKREDKINRYKNEYMQDKADGNPGMDADDARERAKTRVNREEERLRLRNLGYSPEKIDEIVNEKYPLED